MLPVNPAFPGKWYARVNMKCSGFWSNLRILLAHSTPPRVPKAAAPLHPSAPTPERRNIPTPQNPYTRAPQHPNTPTSQHPNLPTPPRGPKAAAPLHPSAPTSQTLQPPNTAQRSERRSTPTPKRRNAPTLLDARL